MDTNLKKINELKILSLISALEKNNMQGFYAKSRDELYEIIDSLIKSDKTITAGGSMTLYESGVIKYLHDKYDGVFKDRDLLPPEQRGELMRQAFTMDTFLTSTNAITENGELFNIDGNGNRVAAMIFGPKQVIVIVGVNKIVKDAVAAYERARSIAAPANCVRLDRNTPCTLKGKCQDCRSEDNICSAHVLMKRQITKNRIKVIFMNEQLGY